MSNSLGTEWYWQPVVKGLTTLLDKEVGRMRKNNWYSIAENMSAAPEPGDSKFRYSTRAPGGYLNNLEHTLMGSAGTPFARNFPPEMQGPPGDKAILNDPGPREVSRRLMTRRQFKPATSLSLLAAAWVQFQIHDWFNHEGTAEQPFQVEIHDDDTWPVDFGRPMKVERTKRALYSPLIYRNKEVHWWDGSQIYGSSQETLRKLRAWHDGKLKIGKDGFLPYDTERETDLTGFTDNWWLGLRMLHTLFAREHNQICDMLRLNYPGLSDDETFAKARLVNAALMAKIHTIEWTPALLNHPTVILGMKADWCGIEPSVFTSIAGVLEKTPLDDEDMKSLKKFAEYYDLKAWTGKGPDEIVKLVSEGKRGLRELMRLLIEGQPRRKHKTKTGYISDGVRSLPEYAMTEEFVSVYRMHPLLPDVLSLRHLEDDSPVGNRDGWTFSEVAFKNARTITDHMTMAEAFYSFGTMHPGALTLNNFPRFLQRLNQHPVLPYPIDLAAVDILRDRERGIPRYNRFREMLYGDDRQCARFSSFEAMTGGDEELAEQLRSVYGREGDQDNVDQVDLLVGLYVEPRPPGFAFSETTFLLFALMAPFRLKSDRWFTEDYTTDKYTEKGMEWIEKNTMRSVLARNYPELRPVLRHVKNPFNPWPRMSNA